MYYRFKRNNSERLIRLLYYLPLENEKRKSWIRMKKVLERESGETTKGEQNTER